MGACCNTADKDTATECEVPGGRPGALTKGNQQFQGNVKSTLDLF